MPKYAKLELLRKCGHKEYHIFDITDKLEEVYKQQINIPCTNCLINQLNSNQDIKNVSEEKGDLEYVTLDPYVTGGNLDKEIHVRKHQFGTCYKENHSEYKFGVFSNIQNLVYSIPNINVVCTPSYRYMFADMFEGCNLNPNLGI